MQKLWYFAKNICTGKEIDAEADGKIKSFRVATCRLSVEQSSRCTRYARPKRMLYTYYGPFCSALLARVSITDYAIP